MPAKVREIKDDAIIEIKLNKNFYTMLKGVMLYILKLEPEEAKIKELVESMSKDIEAFYVKGNKTAGTRVRSACQDLKKLSQDLRIHVQETKNTVKA